jgi:calcineurin-like phosphoesterase family protein
MKRLGKELHGLIALLGLGAGLVLVGFGTPAARASALATPRARVAQNTPGMTIPTRADSVRFAVIGDSGTGESGQYEVAQQMEASRQSFPFDFVLMLGDNIYGAGGPHAFEAKFAEPYKPLLEAGVKFYASLGNHDSSDERFYKPFNMGGQRYYTFRKENAQFFALDSAAMDSKQLDWLENELQKSDAVWKICYFHHPLYSDGAFHGPDLDLRERLEPVFAKYGVNVVFSGHEHFYERVRPQHGIQYFVLGSSGKLRHHNLRPSSEMAAGFDTGHAFMMVQVTGDQLYFEAVSTRGEAVDQGVLGRAAPASAGRTAATGY